IVNWREERTGINRWLILIRSQRTARSSPLINSDAGSNLTGSQIREECTESVHSSRSRHEYGTSIGRGNTFRKRIRKTIRYCKFIGSDIKNLKIISRIAFAVSIIAVSV